MESAPRPAVILVRPTEPGNIGAVARAMANTGLDELIVVEPAAPIDGTSRAFAVGAVDILERAARRDSFSAATSSFQQLVGTSSSRSRSERAEIVTPRELARQLARSRPPRLALVFGPERSGLTTDELAHCSPLVRIPAALRQPTFNLAQAVLLVAYELFLTRDSGQAPAFSPSRATSAEVDGLLDHAHRLLGDVGFARDDTFPSTFRDLRRLAARSCLTSREVQILRGMMRRTENRLTKENRRPGSDE